MAKVTTPDGFFKEISKYIEGEIVIENKFLKNQFLNTLAWAWTEFHDTDLKKDTRGKYVSEYWSEKAWEKMRSILVEKGIGSSDDETLEIPFSLVSTHTEGLRAEHVITKKLFVETLRELKKSGQGVPKNFRKLLDERFFSCILTSDEAKALDKHNKEFTAQNKDMQSDDFKCWVRYRQYNENKEEEKRIVVYKCNLSYKEYGSSYRWLVSKDHKVDLEQ